MEFFVEFIGVFSRTHLQNFVHIITDLQIAELGNQIPEVCIVNMLKDLKFYRFP